MAVVVDKDACIGCGACRDVCPAGAMKSADEGKSFCDESECLSCMACVGSCPVGAIREA
ncbi:MAG: 4Fe-4S binding protein [Solobacterium sp.]|nr:4Fe-4S binding protein [Solobacterium sp.]MBR2793546.1 4Fe-4S binding protein [Solobacterium sp.]